MNKRKNIMLQNITLVDMMQHNDSEILRFQHVRKLSSLKNCRFAYIYTVEQQRKKKNIYLYL